MPSRSGNVFALKYAAREIHQLPLSPELVRLGAAAIARARQQPIQNILAKPVDAVPKWKLARVGDGLGSMSPSDTRKRIEVYTRADEPYVEELGSTCQRAA